MKQITLVRHAKSSWKDLSLSDFDRPLNGRGKRDAPMMGKRLAKQLPMPDLIVSSPARRAITTARKIAQQLSLEKSKIVPIDDIYEAHYSELVELMRRFDDSHDHVMMFGHNPGFTDACNELTSVELDNLPTCGVFSIRFNVMRWSEVGSSAGELVLFDFPKNVENRLD